MTVLDVIIVSAFGLAAFCVLVALFASIQQERERRRDIAFKNQVEGEHTE
jgi:hypothetical protein